MSVITKLLSYIFFFGIYFLCAQPAVASNFKTELLDTSDGFNTSIIFSITQDTQGYLWFGTGYHGIFRYDGKKIVTYKHQLNNPNSLAHNNSGNLVLDNNGNIWIGSWGGSASIFDPRTLTFTHFEHDPNDPNTISGKFVQEIYQDSDNTVWLGTFSKGLNKFKASDKTFQRFKFNDFTGEGTSGDRIWDITATDHRGLWIGTNNGLNYYNKVTGKFSYYFPESILSKKGKNKIRRILPISFTQLLVGTDNGVLSFNTKNKTFTAIPVKNDLFLAEIYSIIKTSFNDIWVASANGVYQLKQGEQQLTKLDLGIDDSCSQTLFEDKQHIIWLTCEGLGVYKIVPNQTFQLISSPDLKQVTATLANENTLLISTPKTGIQQFNPKNQQFKQLSNSQDFQVSRFLKTKNDEIFYISDGKLFQFFKNGQSTQISPNDNDPFKKTFINLTQVIEYSDDVFLVSSDHGLFVYNHRTKSFSYFNHQQANNGLSDPYIVTLFKDKQNRIWLGTINGLNLWLPKQQKFKHFYFTDKNSSNSSNFINTIAEDSKHNMWVGTQQGLFLLKEKNNQFNITKFDTNSGLANDNISDINEDIYGNLWLLSNLGLSQITLDGKVVNIKNYDQRDGLSSSRYFLDTMSQTSDGTIYFSSRNGIFYFHPSNVGKFKRNANVILTNFEVLGHNELAQLYKPSLTNIHLKYNQNYLKFEFAALDFANARRINYRYKLDGFDNTWIYSGNNNQAIYNNLPGGDYTFRVSAFYNDREKYKHDLIIPVSVDIPFWQRWWMYVFYAIALLFISFLLIQRKMRNKEEEIARQKYFVEQLESQVSEKTASIKEESLKLQKANNVKSEFLANMSHEIRTPLTAVIGQAEAIINHEIEADKVIAEVEIIYNNSLYLLQLLNNILDLSKIEANKFELTPEPTNLLDIIDELNNIFSEQAKNKQLNFTITHSLPSTFYINIDSLRLKQVLINLCSNAIKFTAKGKVELIINIVSNKLIFKIIDTGIGLTQEQITEIFDPFTQGDNSISRRFGGSGLGLSLSEKLVQLMNGFISVESEVAKGSTFSVVLPLTLVDKIDLKHIENNALNNHNNITFTGSILLAEDHPDNRRLIARWLTKLGFTVYTASDGKQALELYNNHTIDLILMDIQMPVMDGIEALSQLKKLGCSQPVIALTANAMKHEIEQFIQLGFTDHLTKPIERHAFINKLSRYFKASNANIKSTTAQIPPIEAEDLQQSFINGLVNEKTTLNQHYEQQNFTSLQQAAHRLAGAAQMFGFTAIYELAVQVENIIKNDNLPALDCTFYELIETIEAAINNN